MTLARHARQVDSLVLVSHPPLILGRLQLCVDQRPTPAAEAQVQLGRVEIDDLLRRDRRRLCRGVRRKPRGGNRGGTGLWCAGPWSSRLGDRRRGRLVFSLVERVVAPPQIDGEGQQQGDDHAPLWRELGAH